MTNVQIARTISVVSLSCLLLPSLLGIAEAVTNSGFCADRFEDCEGWSHGGECTLNPAFMLPNCPNACHQCETKDKSCYDHDESCVGWALQGECQLNEAFMKKNCRHACRFCFVQKYVEANSITANNQDDSFAERDGLNGIRTEERALSADVALREIFRLRRKAFS